MLRFCIEYSHWTHWASFEVNEDVAFFCLPNEVDATHNGLSVTFQTERTFMISLYGCTMSCNKIFGKVLPS